MMKYVVALDAGTTSVRAMLYDLKKRKFVEVAQQEVEQSFPNLGWVEQDANEIYYKAAYVLNRCLTSVDSREVAGIGIANQRETVVFWNRETGEPVCPAIVWQCRRTEEFCERIPKDMREKIKKRTGLITDAYFSASKIHWGIENVPEVKRLLNEGNLCVGTVESYLIFKLTGGKSFVTDYTNACRTMLFDIHTLKWDEELCDYFGIPLGILPTPLGSTDKMGEFAFAGRKMPIAGVAGDQQAALVGQACMRCGDGKVTYGTGLFMLFHTGKTAVDSKSGLITTIGCAIQGKIDYALEGSVFNAGSSVQWLRDGLGLIKTSAESETLASSVPDSGGVYFVPAFTGLGAPYWRGDARGLFSGITRGTTAAHMTRAVLESIAFAARDLADCMQKDSGIALNGIRCDGGASANNFLMQFQSDVLCVNIDRPSERESTALGAALLCAIALGIFGREDIFTARKSERVFLPSDDREKYNALYRNYQFAVKRALYRE